MNARWLVLLAAVSGSALALPDVTDERAGITLSSTTEGRAATLLGGQTLDATVKPSEIPALRLIDMVYGGPIGPLRPLDEGGGIDSGTRPILALLLGLLVGFGIGHLVAQDRNGFILFLVVDLAILAVTSVFHYGLGFGWFWGLGGAVWLISHIIQGLDAYSQAGGGRIVEWTREQAVEFASTGRRHDDAPVLMRVAGFAF